MRGKPTRCNGVDLDVVHTPFAGQVFGEGNDPTFTRVIPNGLKLRGSASQSGYRSNVDDFSAALGRHTISDSLREEEGARQICLDNLVPVLKPHFFDGGAPGCSGVIDQNIDVP